MAHVGLDYLDRLPAREVPGYAVAALEREALETLRWMDLFLLPVEAQGGDRKRQIWNHLRNTAAWKLGRGTIVDQRTDEQKVAEAAAIAAVEAEMLRDFPEYGDPVALEQAYQQAGGRAA